MNKTIIYTVAFLLCFWCVYAVNSRAANDQIVARVQCQEYYGKVDRGNVENGLTAQGFETFVWKDANFGYSHLVAIKYLTFEQSISEPAVEITCG